MKTRTIDTTILDFLLSDHYATKHCVQLNVDATRNKERGRGAADALAPLDEVGSRKVHHGARTKNEGR